MNIIKRKTAASIIFALLLCASIPASQFSPAHAAPGKDLSDIERKIEEGKEKVEEAKKEERSLLINLKTIDSSIKKISDEVGKYDRLISMKIKKISSVNKEIITLQSSLTKRRAVLSKRLEALYKHSRNETVMLLLSSNDYLEILKRGKYISYIAEHDQKLLISLNADIAVSNTKKDELEILKKELESNGNTLKEKTDQLQQQRAQKSDLLTLTKKRRSSYEDEIKELTSSSKKVRAMIKRLSRINRAEPASDRGFISAKGNITWPLSGKVVVPFGKHIDPEFNIPVYKNGIEINSIMGSTVNAVMKGKVVFADKFKGYGLLMILDHGGGYHTLYGQLSEIFHKTGAIIKKGSAVGKTGRSASLDASTLYFEIRYKGKPLDPLVWLDRRQAQ